MNRQIFHSRILIVLIALILFGFNNCGVVDVSKFKMNDTDGSTTVANPGDPGGPGEGNPGEGGSSNFVATFVQEVCLRDRHFEGQQNLALCQNETLAASGMIELLCTQCSSSDLLELKRRETVDKAVIFNISEVTACISQLQEDQPTGGGGWSITGWTGPVDNVKGILKDFPECGRFILRDH